MCSVFYVFLTVHIFFIIKIKWFKLDFVNNVFGHHEKYAFINFNFFSLCSIIT